MTKSILTLHPATHQRHAIHRDSRIWAETNCYVDLWIELLHALGHEPVALFPFTFEIDFEGDQWTFFKCPLSDIEDLYGLDVQELAIWRTLAAHLEEQVARGRPVLVEVDSYFLPDTAGTAYRRLHWKSTVAVIEIDVAKAHLGYFHNQGYYHVRGDDFLGLLRLTNQSNPLLLAPYVEFVKIRHQAKPTAPLLLARSLRLLERHLNFVPEKNPFLEFRVRLAKDLDWLLQSGLETFHQYSFATLRQCGACFELSHAYLEWLAGQGERGLEKETRAFRDIAAGAKAVQFQLARAMSRRKALSLSQIDVMAELWQEGIRGLQSRYR